jgi:hypothetical protein
VATAGAPGSVAFSAVGVVIKGCEAIATTTVTPFVAKCSWVPAAGENICFDDLRIVSETHKTNEKRLKYTKPKTNLYDCLFSS